MQGLWNLIGKMGSGAQNFPYEVGEKLPASESKSPWSVHQGKKKATGQAVTVFALDVKASSDHKIQLAKSAIKRLKTLRHPNIVTYIDSLESDTLIYLVTEPVTPLEIYMADETSIKSDLAISWGIHQIAAGLSFLLNDCNLMHGNICMASIYVDVAGEWKLGGVEYVQPIEPPPGADVTDNSILPALQVYDPPEGRKYSKMNKKLQKWSADVWGLGCLIWEVFNGTLPRPASLKTVGKIPKSLLVHYGELVSANPRIRPNPTKFIENCRASGNYLDNAFVEANLFLSELQIKDPKEQKKFFSSLSSSVDTFPEPFCKHRILPQLINAFEFGAAGSAVLGPLFKVGKLLESEEYEKRIVPCVVKLFSSTDRATRIQLLQQLELFVQHLKPQVVDEQIFPHVALGFGDTVPAMREQTVKAMLLLTPKLSEKTINSHLLKHFAKLQMDQEAGIRTNTTVCLGKIACHLPPATRQKVLVSAFLRPFRDPFPPARTAGVMAFCVTSEFYPLKDVAARILPALCPLTVDPEKKVRDQTFKAVKLFIGKLEKASEDPESAMNTAADQSTADGSASSWTGWAVTSLTSKLYRGGAPAAAGAPGSATPPAEQAGPPPATGKPVTDSPRRPQPQKPPATRPSATPPPVTGDESGSDYDEDWGGDWSEPKPTQSRSIVGEMRNDLMAVKQECESWQNAAESRKDAEQEDADSGSDYDDWNNDDWSTITSDKPQDKPDTSSTYSNKAGQPKSASLLFAGPADTFGDIPFADDPFSGLSNVEQKKSDKLARSKRQQKPVNKPSTEAGTKTQGTAKKTQNDGGGFGGGNWDTSDWGSLESSVQDPVRTGSFGSTKSSKSTASSGGVGGGDWGLDEVGPLDNVPSDKPKVKSVPAKTEPPSHASAGGRDDGGWDTGDWGSMDAVSTGGPSKAELAKQKREERKQQRLLAMKEKRAAKGPSKLGGVKIQ